MQIPIGCSVCKNNSARIITDPESGEIVCNSCGIVISDKIQDITRPEQRAFSLEVSNKSRTGTPTSLARYDMGLATVIGKADRDASGRKIDAEMRSTMNRLRTWDLRAHVHTSVERNLIQAFNELDILKDKLGLSDAIVEKSAYVYRKVLDRGLVRGRTTLGIMAAATYAGCREMETPWTLKDIAAASNIKRKDIARNYRMLLFELDFKVPSADPMKCIVKVANKANLTENTKRRAISIMMDIIKKEIPAGKDPMGIAATVLYISCLKTGENKTQTQIARAAGVTDVTVRNRLKELRIRLRLNY